MPAPGWPPPPGVWPGDSLGSDGEGLGSGDGSSDGGGCGAGVMVVSGTSLLPELRPMTIPPIATRATTAATTIPMISSALFFFGGPPAGPDGR